MSVDAPRRTEGPVVWHAAAPPERAPRGEAEAMGSGEEVEMPPEVDAERAHLFGGGHSRREFAPGVSGERYDVVLEALQQGNAFAQSVHHQQMRALQLLDEKLSYSNPLFVFINPILQISHEVYKKSPVILLASGIALAVNYFGAPRYPVLATSSDTTLEGSVALAKFVSTTFLFKSALEPFVMQIEHYDQDTHRPQETKSIYHQRAIRYFNPLALSLIVTYARGWNVKPLEATLYSAGLFVFIKLLGKGFDYICNWQDRSLAAHGQERYAAALDEERTDESL
ncbi:MAG: hypothetical protein JSS10_00035 [Verrucomicrobia bacterium]|nr:hypothetical protein [Verrucomicrobiota bacterium]